MKPTWDKLARLAYSDSKDKSLGQRVDFIGQFIGSGTDVGQLTNQTVVDLLNTLRSRGLKGSTINRYLSVLSRVVSLYRRSYDPTFTLYIPWQKEPAGRMDWLTLEDEQKLMPHLEPDLALVVRVLTITGMRLGELLSLSVDQIEDSGWIRLWKTKTNRPRSVPLPSDTARQLRALVASGLPPAHKIRKGLRDALKASGVNSRITPHSLRHTTATRLIKADCDLLVTARYMGHNSLKTTQRYVHLDDKDIRKAMDKLA